jgi:hypothetical protein
MDETELYRTVNKTFLKVTKPTECLGGSEPVSYVWRRNDDGMEPEAIAEKLASCGL